MLERPPLRLQLDPEQSRAARESSGNLLVIAGPGAGKTRVIIGRIQELLEHGGPDGETVDPRTICCITFTNKAAAEIVARIRDHFPAQAEEITVKTFHGLAREIVSRYPAAADLPRHFHIIDEATQNDILAFALKKYELQRDPLVLRRLKSHLDLEKSALRYPLTHPRAKGDAQESMPDLFSYYQAFLTKEGVVDFNDLLLAAMQVLLASPEALAWIHARCRYLLLDEFQDVNQVQYELVRLLISPEANVLAVADGNQMIYGWRGSDAEYLRAFVEDFNAGSCELNRNYRAEESLQWLAQTLIARNDPNHGPLPAIPDDFTDRAATVFHLLDEEEEVLAVEKILSAIRHQDPTLHWRDIAILYRTHGLADRLEKDLALGGIPVQRVRKAVEDPEGGLEHLIAYLRLSLHLFDWDLYRAMEYPRKLLSPQENLWLNLTHQAANVDLLPLIEGELPPQVSPLSQGKLKRFAKLIHEVHGTDPTISPSAFFQELVEALGEFRSPFTEDEEAQVLRDSAKLITEIQPQIEALRAFLHEVPQGRLLLVHPGTVTGSLAGLISIEAVREYLHLKTAVAALDALTVAQIQKLAKGPAQEEIFVLTFGLTPDQSDILRERIVESGTDIDQLDLATQAEVIEAFDVPYSAFSFWAWFLAQPLEPQAQEAVFLDLETTGIEPFRCHILQVAAERVNLRTGAVLAQFNSYVRPPEKIPSKVIELTGITDELVAHAPQAARVVPEFLEFVGTAPVVGHNLIGFDLPILKRYAKHLQNAELTNLPIDTLLWARELFPRQNHSQEALCARFGLTPPDDSQHHRADADVSLNRQLFAHLERADHLKRGILFSQVALVLLALASFQDERTPDALRIAVRESAKRIIQRVEQDDRDIAMLIGRHFDEFQASRLLALMKQLANEPLGDDPAHDRFERHTRIVSEQILRYEESGQPEGIRGFLDFYYLLNDQDYLDSEDTVKLLTVHAAKGLEFEVVIIVGMEQGSFPHYLAVNNIHRIEEERRLLYVALTRARRKVYLTYVQTRHGRYRPPSMFLRELPAQLVRQFKSDKVAQLESSRGKATVKR